MESKRKPDVDERADVVGDVVVATTVTMHGDHGDYGDHGAITSDDVTSTVILPFALCNRLRLA